MISVKVDKEVKDSAQAVARSAGLNLSALINTYLRQLVAARKIEIYAREQMAPYLEGLIAEVEAEVQAGRVSPKFDSAEDFLADLKA